VSAVRTDKPTPYVQAVENGVVVHKSVELGARGAAGSDAVVAVKGLADGAVIVRGEIGALREGTKVRFTQLASAAPGPAASAPAKPAP
jgi:multidrug efflux system membrane fusion protein